MFTQRTIWSTIAGVALVGSGLVGTAPATAAPAGGSGEVTATWEEPTPGTSAEIAFADAVTPARAASMSPHLAEIMREAKRVRTVDIEAGALDSPLAAESVAIELFDGVRIQLETTVALREGVETSRAYSAGGEETAAIITLIGGDVHGAIWTGATKYGIEPLGGGQHLVYEEGRTFPDEAAPLVADAGSAGPASPAAAADFGTLATTTIDIMVAYDDAAVAQFGSVAATEAEIVESINVSNMLYVNSQIDLELALTNMPHLSYTPNATDGTDNDQTYLSAIASKTDGIVDSVHTERDANEADLAAVISNMGQFCGYAFYPGTSNPPEQGAYSLTDIDCAVGSLTFPHEIGHNLCADHDPANAQNGSPCEPDGYGHFSVTENLRTVMSYANSANGCTGCMRIPYFSNPNIAYNGWTTGILGSRDNARVIGVRAPDVAAYRPAPPACEVDYVISGGWPGNVQVDLAVTNNNPFTIGGWTAEWTFTGDESVYNSWGVNISQVGADATATGTGFGASIPAGGTVTVGFQATVTGTPTVPAPISCGI